MLNKRNDKNPEKIYEVVVDQDELDSLYLVLTRIDGKGKRKDHCDQIRTSLFKNVTKCIQLMTKREIQERYFMSDSHITFRP